jgi:hypothetical protein
MRGVSACLIIFATNEHENVSGVPVERPSARRATVAAVTRRLLPFPCFQGTTNGLHYLLTEGIHTGTLSDISAKPIYITVYGFTS